MESTSQNSKPKKDKVDPGPELPTDESQTPIAYLTFNELQNPIVASNQDEEKELVN